MSIIAKIRFLRAFLIAVRDPKRTEEIFKLTNDRRLMGGENHDAVFEALASSPKTAAALKEKKLPQWNLAEFARLPAGSLGLVYYEHMKRNQLEEKFYPDLPNQRDIDFVRMWIRKTHDVLHVLTGFDTSVEGEAALQAFYFAQLKVKGSIF